MDVRDVLSLTPHSLSRKRTLKPPNPPKFSTIVQKSDIQARELVNTPSSINEATSNKISRSIFKEPVDIVESGLHSHNNDLPEQDESENNGSSVSVGESEITESTIRKLTVLLEKHILANQVARTKFADQPTKFMDSEISLQETLDSMQILAANPSLYHVLAKQIKPLHLLLGLISHENTDISINVIDLLNELLEPNGLKEAGSQAVNPLIDLLFSNQLIHLLTQNLVRLDESIKDEEEGVHKTLGIIESLLEVREDLSIAIAQQGVFAWVLKRIQRTTFDKNKLYSSEILAILLQLDDANKIRLGEMDAIDVLLQQLANYKRRDPLSREEAEFMYNMFDCLCNSLMIAANKDKFLKGEGVQLMNLMLREKYAARDCALKVLDYAMSVVTSSSNKSDEEIILEDTFLSEGEAAAAANCNKFVEVLGLRTIFPLFMHSPQARVLKLAKSTNEKTIPGPTSSEMEEHIISIVASLLRHCTGQQQTRVIAKFVENEHEKVDRLVELHFNYQERVSAANVKIIRFKQRLSNHPDVTPEEIEEAISIKRMDSGLLTHQLIDVALLDLCNNGQPSILTCIRQLLKMRGASISVLIRTAQDYVNSLGDGETSSSHEKKRVMELIQRTMEILK